LFTASLPPILTLQRTYSLQGSGSGAGALIADTEGDIGLAMNRAPLLRVLIALLPGDILHAGKKLTSLKQTPSGVEIAFADGTAARFDAVIGADGIFSTVRNHVLQESATKHAASSAGWWDCRNLVPAEKARAVLGEEPFEVDREYFWAKDGAFMMHALVGNGSMVECIITVSEMEPLSDQLVTKSSLETAFASAWLDKPATKEMIEARAFRFRLLETQMEERVWCNKHYRALTIPC
jgi:salicylate hydroxylase